jgi:hypothetical protein
VCAINPSLCVDGANQGQQLQRTQPVLPVGPGRVEGDPHGYTRHGTTLFAALHLLKGAVLATRRRRHRHQESLSFRRESNQHYNGARHALHRRQPGFPQPSEDQRVAGGAAAPEHSLHPDLQVPAPSGGRFFSLITDKAICRGSFNSVRQLVQPIDRFARACNTDWQPVPWTAPRIRFLRSCIHFGHASAGQDTGCWRPWERHPRRHGKKTVVNRPLNFPLCRRRIGTLQYRKDSSGQRAQR